MLLPISDDDSQLSGVAYVTWAILIANITVYVLGQQLGANQAFTMGYAAIPYEIFSGEDLIGPIRVGHQAIVVHAPGPSPIQLTLISSMFMHGSIAHLGGNMLYLWIFGDNIEHRFGHVPFLVFYLASGLAAAITQMSVAPASPVPMLGASGAIAGVMGAYIVLFPRNRVHAIIFFRIVTIPAVAALGLWIAFQIFSSMSNAGAGGVAYSAHIGGFMAGVIIAGFYRLMAPNDPKAHAFRSSHQHRHTRRY